jgi:hypothetical protein
MGRGAGRASPEKARLMRKEYGKTLGCAALLFALNACLMQWLFRTAYTNQMGSIEAAFIGIARYVSRHWSDLGWFPIWYGGIPYADSYPPLLHWVVGLGITLTGADPGLAYHFVVATVYCLGPVTLFWMAWRLSGSRPCALVAAIGYSLISPTCLLVRSVAMEVDGTFGPRRLITLVNYGEGPHLTSMMLLPLAIGILHVALEKRKPWYWVAAGFAIASVPMSNWLGGMALAMGLAAYLCAGLPGSRRTVSTVLCTAALGVYAYALVMPWFSPATIAVIRANAPRVANNFRADTTQRIFVVLVAAVYLLLVWAMERWKVARHIRFAWLAALVTGAAALGSYWFKLSLLPQPDRYHQEMDMFLWVAVVFAVWPLVRRIPPRAALVTAGVLLLACLPIVKKQRRTARWEERPIKIENTIEYKTAKWLDVHMPGSRVFAPGTIGFWLNAFSDTPQLTGGFDNGISNPFVPDAIFHVYAGDTQQWLVELLQVYGCDAMIGGGKDSAEYYHPVSHPEKLRGLRELWRDGGDAVYDIPRRSRSLAHVMRPGDQVPRTLAQSGWSMLDPYLAALDNPEYPAAEFRWKSASDAVITAPLKPDQVVSVQVSWDKGWTAYSGGHSIRTWGDKLGQMVLEPQCSGACTIELKYDGGAEGRFARAMSRLALAGGLCWILVALWRKRSGLTKMN